MISSGNHWRHFAVALALQGLLLSAGSAVRAQPADHGVSPRQAEQAIRDEINVFIATHPSDQNSKVRVKISDLVRVYSKDVGWITVAVFDGAVVSDSSMPGQTQKFYHGLLKIISDRNKDVRMVVNEGAGLDEMEATVATLRKELPETVGGWKEWGGNPADMPPSDVSGKVPPEVNVVPPQPGLNSRTPGPGNPALTEKYAEMNALNKKCHDPKNPNIREDCAEYQKMYQEMFGAK